jgi:L-threonylcarbamoyladenylate synthase
MMQTTILNTKSDSIQIVKIAVQLLLEGEVIAFPTDTVYGFGVDINNPTAAKRIYSLKNRSADKPLNALIDSLESVSDICNDIPDDFYKLAEVFFPGPLAVILKRSETVSSIVTSGMDSLAVRMPDCKIVREIIQSLGRPIASTSANFSDQRSANNADDVYKDFNRKFPLLIDGGKSTHGKESTVLSLVTHEPTIFRQGVITKEDIEAVLNKSVRTI